jgi:tetratricopeptide (TPR) repeat protein
VNFTVRAGATLTILMTLARSAAPQEGPARRPSDYLALVNEYKSGAITQPLLSIAGWTALELDAVAQAIRSKPSGFPLQVAIVFHFEREMVDRENSIRRRRGAPDCTVGPHARMTERLVSIAHETREGKDFVARFAAVASDRYRSMYCFSHARFWAEVGLKSAPRDARLLLSRGRADEVLAVANYDEPSLSGRFADKTRQLQLFELEDHGRRARDARGAFEKAVALDPGLGEAYLHLGRMHWRNEKPAEARHAYEEAVFRTQGGSLYLAHVFLGGVLDETGDHAAARRHYDTALRLFPSGQAASAALAHSFATEGLIEEARDVLEKMLHAAGRRKSDPFLIYLTGSTTDADQRLTALRLEVSR